MKNTLQQIVCLSCLGSTLLLAPISSQALTVEKVTNPRTNYGGWVTDKANILSDRTEAELNRLIADLEATRYKQGKCLITDKCHCCDYLQEKERTIPRLPPPSSNSYISSNYGGDSSCSGGGYSGGSDFGGGSSDFGGAGGDW